MTEVPLINIENAYCISLCYLWVKDVRTLVFYHELTQSNRVLKQESAFEKHKSPQKHKIIKQFSRIQMTIQKQNCKDNEIYFHI